ncbi:MAG: hypothetical protein EPN47_09875 [Acidobacteria bacterium]|nr:MAG: hypothetical protein EPN47_09875 [Acidobacteriota bacterium]
MRTILYFGLVSLISSLQCLAITSGKCSAGAPVTQFRLMLVSEHGTPPLPVNSVNEVLRGQKLKYEPPTEDQKDGPKGKITVILVPASSGPSSKIEVLEPQPANTVEEWKVPARSSIVGVVYGPHGLDVKKVNSLVERNKDLIPQLADYAEKAATVEALVQTLSKYEQAQPASRDLDAVLKGFSSQYGVSLPSINSSAPADQQATQLLHAVVPALSSYDPLAERTSSGALQQSAGVAAWVAALFWGSTPVGLAAGGASLLQNMRTLMFPDTDFRAAFAQPTASGDLELCTTQKETTKRMRTAYLWVRRVPNSGPPTASLPATAHIPLDWKSDVKVICATRAQLRDLARAREWRLVSDDHHSTVPVQVTVGPSDDTLALDLSKVKLSPGKYKLAALWDWTPFSVAGTVEVHKFADLSTAKIAPESEDNLIHGSGTVAVKLTGPDFEFVDKLALVPASNQNATAKELTFTLEKGKQGGGQNILQTEVDTTILDAGRYFLMLTQLNGAIQDLPLTIHPPNPKLLGLPLRANLGEKEQTIILQGSGLDRITRITGDNAEWSLTPVSKGYNEAKGRKATLRLAPNAQRDELLSASLYVEGISKPLSVADVVHVVGPRPVITDVRASFPKETNISLAKNEIPAGSPVSFVVQTEHMGPSPALTLDCSNDNETRQPLTLHPGDKTGSAQLDFAGSGALFLSVDPGAVGQSGCLLDASVTDETTGSSNPYALGRVTRLPNISRFTLNNQKLGDSLYAGTLIGQDLQMIEKTGWEPGTGYPVQGIPTPVPGSSQDQTLKIEMAWPPPSPRAPIYIWLRGENEGRLTAIRY